MESFHSKADRSSVNVLSGEPQVCYNLEILDLILLKPISFNYWVFDILINSDYIKPES